MSRPVQQSLVDPSLERPVGPLPMSVVVGNNSVLIASIAPLYLTGSVLDVTYGKGNWWTRFTPDPFTFHDLATGVDFRNLPYDDDSFDAVCFDPPYVASGGPPTHKDAARLRTSFGVNGRSQNDLWELVEEGLHEAARVTRKWLLVKSMDFVGSDALQLGHVKCIRWVESYGFRTHDLIVHATGTGPGGHNIFTPKRARRAHSYLLVFRKAAAAAASTSSSDRSEQ